MGNPLHELKQLKQLINIDQLKILSKFKKNRSENLIFLTFQYTKLNLTIHYKITSKLISKHIINKHQLE